jgi:AraC-like DNA-binding protein
MEHIISFLYDENRTCNQFNIEMTGITYPDPHYSIDRKCSAINCLEYVMEGEGTIHNGEETLHPSKGDVYILPKGHHHRYYSSTKNPWKKIWMNVDGPLCDALFQVYNLEGVRLIKDLNLYDLFRTFLNICEKKDISVNQVFQQSALVFHEILASIDMHRNALPISKNAAAYQLKDYIDQNIYNKFTMEELAKLVNLSPSQLTRIYKKEFSQTPYDYILTQKIRTAKLLLANTTIPVKQVSYKLNFADEHYFSNIFKERTGTTPSNYRKRYYH